ncbi:hypothetical protein FIBSPDRAFT_949561 [Athelia psychrophila]|uniref:Uncharacterized protein n=1 Tax=Athelia psychrophila TaxID=1759441 RepID=A0A166PRX0_9AGAM|nr:hypothetical protein FIBSPDRAFT_949561 [Fibularhizoctonia sp. CBS 109695]
MDKRPRAPLARGQARGHSANYRTPPIANLCDLLGTLSVTLSAEDVNLDEPYSPKTVKGHA